jgi:L,D-transpeptidase ErfK/SrfK
MLKLPIKINTLAALVLLVLVHDVNATAFLLPANNEALLGSVDRKVYVKAKKHETLLDIARQYNLGQNQIVKANKSVDRWMPSKSIEKTASDKEGNQFLRLGTGKDIHIPGSYLLPSVARKGIVLNLPEYRLYYYREGQVITHPISIGRVDWNTPLGKTSIIAKTRNPTWTPPASIRKEHAAKGDILPAVFPAGPDNPLGLFAMRLGRAGYLIHSTNKPLGVGMRVSHGCIRMYPEDIERIFPSVAVGTSVMIVNEPIKVGWSNNALYIEVHPDLEDKQRSYQQRLSAALSLIEKVKGNEFINVKGNILKKALIDSDGIPVAIYQAARLNTPKIVVQPQEQIIKSTILPVQKQEVAPIVSPVVNQEKPARMPPPPRLNTPALNVQTPVSQPAPVVERRYIPPRPRVQDYNDAGNTTIVRPPATTPVLNNNVGDNKEVRINTLPPPTPKLKVLPKPPPPRLEEPEYSILKSAVPPE